MILFHAMRTGGCVLDLSMAHNERRVGVKSEHLFGERTVGTLLSRGGHDNGKVEDLSDLGMSHHVVAVESGIPVTSKLVETNLEIEDEQHLRRVLVRWKQSILLIVGILRSCSCRCVPKGRLDDVRYQ